MRRRGKGYYYGAKIDTKWWLKYLKGVFFTKGNGRYWLGDDGFYFLKYATRNPLFIPFTDIIKVEVESLPNKDFSPGGTVITIVWRKDNLHVYSKFRLSYEESETLELKRKIEKMIDTHTSKLA